MGQSCKMLHKHSKILLIHFSLLIFGELCLGLQSSLQCRQAGCALACECEISKPKNCLDILHNGCNTDGIYKVFPDYQSLNFRRGIDVYCDQTTEGGGWVVFQRRMNGSVNFDRKWVDYKYGFGNLDGEFWLGNQIVHMLAFDMSQNSLRVEIETTENIPLVANYKLFSVENESSNYALWTKEYHGDAGDNFSAHYSTPFATYDRDVSNENYPTKYGGGWWYTTKYHSRLNNINGILDQNHTLAWMRHGPEVIRTELKFRLPEA